MNDRDPTAPGSSAALSPLALPFFAATGPALAGIAVLIAEHLGLLHREAGFLVIVMFCSAFSAGCIWLARKRRLEKEQSQSHAQRTLHQVRNRLNAALIANEIGTWEWDIPNDKVYADANLAAMFGVSLADANGGPISAYLYAIHPEDLESLRIGIDAAIQESVPLDVEYRLRGGGGAERWVLARGHVVRNAAGQAMRLPGVVLDITEQRRVEAQLRKSEARRRLALESAGLGTWTVDVATMQLVTDARFREFFGVHGEALDYAAAVSLIHPEDRPQVEEAVAASARAVDPRPYDLEYRVVRTDGTIRWVHAQGRANTSGSGAADSHSFDGTLADITQRKQAEQEREQLLQSERAARAAAERAGRIKDEFLATLSHELRTPLSAITGWTQILKRTLSPQDLAKGIEVIERNARLQTQIIEDLLDMSAIISGKVRLQVEVLDLPAIVRLAVENAKPAADARRIALRLHIEPLPPDAMRGDPARLQQVLWNLLSNAIKFTPPDGHVEVSLARVGSQLEVAVTDSGEGIPAHFLPHVFDRFRQADASTTRNHGGLGLGLSIVRQIAELHGGTVRASSAGPGLGSTFVVSLPISAPHSDPLASSGVNHVVADEEPGPASPAGIGIDGVRVLVVDDELDAREMIQRLLEERGALVTATASANEALQALGAASFDVLVSDIGMPGEDGYALMRQIRTLPRTSGGAIPSVALTAFARPEDRERAAAAGFARHVSKPVEAMELITAIASQVEDPMRQP